MLFEYLLYRKSRTNVRNNLIIRLAFLTNFQFSLSLLFINPRFLHFYLKKKNDTVLSVNHLLDYARYVFKLLGTLDNYCKMSKPWGNIQTEFVINSTWFKIPSQLLHPVASSPWIRHTTVSERQTWSPLLRFFYLFQRPFQRVTALNGFLRVQKQATYYYRVRSDCSHVIRESVCFLRHVALCCAL